MCIKLKKAVKSASVVPMDAPAQKNSRVPAPAVVKIVNKNKEILGVSQGFLCYHLKLLYSYKITVVTIHSVGFIRIHMRSFTAGFYKKCKESVTFYTECSRR